MKKLLSTLVVMMFVATAAYAHCPCGCEGQVPPPPKGEFQNMKRDCPPDCKCPKCQKGDFEKFTKEHFKNMEAKKDEFEKRLNLTDKQKEKMASLHEKQMKKMRKLDAKIRKQEEKIGELKRQKMEAKKDSIEDFEATLTEEQKAELEKIKQEHRDAMKKFEPKGFPGKCPCMKGCPDKCQKDCPQKEPVKAPYKGKCPCKK